MHSLFNNKDESFGYVPLDQYLHAIDSFEKEKRWKIPLTIMDRAHLVLLRLVNKYSWFSDFLFVQQDSEIGLGYEQIVNAMRKSFGELRLEKQISPHGLPTHHEWRMYLGQTPLSYGSDIVDDNAISKAIGEAFERYFFLKKNVGKDRTDIHMTYGEIIKKKKEVYFPPLHHTFSKEQLESGNFVKTDTDTKVIWIKGRNVLTEKTVLIPKQLVFASVQKLVANSEGIMYEATSNGAAGWFTKDGALYRGLFELVQRDTFLVAWLTKKAFDTIDVTSFSSDEVKQLVKNFKSAKIEIQLLHGKNDFGIPTVIVLGIDSRYAKPQAYIVAHSEVTFTKAALCALYELYPFVQYEKVHYSLPDNYNPFTTKGILKTERMNIWSGTKYVERIQKIQSSAMVRVKDLSNQEIAGETDSEILRIIGKRLWAQGEEYIPLYYEAKHPLLKKSGYHVVKCFIPGLFPFFLSENLATIKSKRLDTYQLTEHSDIISKLYTYPHPFP